jgi:two-component system, NarL family, sensor histidine kinase DegS
MPAHWRSPSLFRLISLSIFVVVTAALQYYVALGAGFFSLDGVVTSTVISWAPTIPILYAAILLGPTAGRRTLIVCMLISLPAAIASPAGPAATIIGFMFLAVLAVLTFWYLGRVEQQRSVMASEIRRLEDTQQKLHYQVDLVETNERRLAALHEISNLVVKGLAETELLERCLNTISIALRVEVVLIFLMSEARQELDLVVASGVSAEFIRDTDRIKTGEGLNGRVASTGEPLVVPDMSNDQRNSRQSVITECLGGSIIVPIKFQDTVLGTISVSIRSPKIFGSDDLATLVSIGNEVGVAVWNARSNEERNRAIARLQISEHNNRALFESANVPIVVRGLNGTIVAGNQSFAGLTGCPVDCLVGMDISTVLRRRPADSVNPESQQDVEYDEWTLTNRDGNQAVVTLSTSQVTLDGDIPALQHVVRDITAERRAAENLRLYAQEVTRAQEEERKRIARELHDDTMQVIGALSRETDNFLRRNAALPDNERQFLTDLRERLNQALRDVRRFSQNLRPSVLDDLGLLAAVKSLLNELRDSYQIDAQLQVVGEERRFVPDKEVLIFRTIQEAVNNIRRHSDASTARITIAFEPPNTYITISDNGQGFGTQREMPGLPRSDQLGLVGIQERVRLLGGSVQIQSILERGTTLSLIIPS